MSSKLYFINEQSQEVAKVLSKLKPGSIEKECLKKGFPLASDVNKFCIIFGKDGINLCYRYFENPTILMDLHQNELPAKGWELILKKS